MKRCPTCEKTFDDSMRFCQSDGTPLVDDAEPIDPYKTMVARPGDIAAAMPVESSETSIPAPKDDDEVLQLPVESDPLKTMYASEDEIRNEMAAKDAANEQVMEIPPLVETPAPAPPRFNEPELSPPSFGDMAPPPSPFGQTSPPIPSPFSEPKPATYDPPAPNFGAYAEPEPAVDEPTFNPFNQSSAQAGEPLAQAEWMPPPAESEASWQNQDAGQNTPFQPSAPGAGGQNQTLAIVSLATGILSILCCGFLTGIPAMITGFMAKNKAETEPLEYSGRGLALAGMITGGIGTVLGIIGFIYYLFMFSTMAF